MKKGQVPQITTKPFKLFLDLDGVFADFNGKFYELTDKWPHEVSVGQMWKVINAHGEFFFSLNLMPDAEHLWDYCKQYDPTFLTGLPTMAGGRDQKVRWVAKTFGDAYEVHVIPKKEKQLHSGPDKVLIDDTLINIQQWIDKGGHGVHHHGDVWETIDKLEELRLAYAT